MHFKIPNDMQPDKATLQTMLQAFLLKLIFHLVASEHLSFLTKFLFLAIFAQADSWSSKLTQSYPVKNKPIGKTY